MLITGFPVGGGKMDSILSENLLTGTRDFGGNNWHDLDKWQVSTETYNGFTVIERSDAYLGIYQLLQGKAGETYTLSGFVKAPVGVKVNFYASGDSRDTEKFQPLQYPFEGSGNWERKSITFKLLGDATMAPRFERCGSVAGTVSVCALKLEHGENPHPIWTPNPDETIFTKSELKTYLDEYMKTIGG